MKRYILDLLQQWKTKPNRKPLIIQGARQVGNEAFWRARL